MRGLAVLAAALILAGCSMERPSSRFGLEASTTTTPTSTTEVEEPAEVEEPEGLDEVEPTEPPAPPPEPIGLSGTGAQNTPPINLSGAYALDIETSGPCSLFATLRTTAGSEMVEMLPTMDGDAHRTTNLYALPAAEYFIEVGTGPNCAWSFTLTPRP